MGAGMGTGMGMGIEAFVLFVDVTLDVLLYHQNTLLLSTVDHVVIFISCTMEMPLPSSSTLTFLGAGKQHNALSPANNNPHPYNLALNGNHFNPKTSILSIVATIST